MKTKILIGLVISIVILGYFYPNGQDKIAKKEEQNSTKEENRTEIITLFTPSPPIEIEENKIDQQQEQEELKYCLDEVEDFNRRGEKERIFYEYDDNEVEIKIDKNSDGTIDFTNHREFTENGDLLLEEKDFDNDGEIDTKTDYLYNSWDRLEEVEIKAYIKSREEPIVLKVNINYNDEEEIDDSKEGREDIYQLLKSYTHSMVLDMNIDIEYHEEYDDEGRKVFAYLGNKEYMSRSFRYAYDDEENLLSKTLIEMSKAYRYNEDGTIAEEFDGDEQNITYKYDTHRNLIEKRRGDKILSKQKFKVCE